MFKIVIIEDDYIWQTKIELMLSEHPQFKVVGLAETVSKAIELIAESKPDIIISDIFLEKDNVLYEIPYIFMKCPTLFIGSQVDESSFYTLVNYPVSVFLIKPFHHYCLLSTLFHLAKHCIRTSEVSKFLSFSGLKSGIVKVQFSNIVKLEVEGNYSICFNSEGKKYARKISLKGVMKLLDERFLRISKTTVVNVNYISKVDFFDKIVYINNEANHVGRPYLKKLKDYYNGFLG